MEALYQGPRTIGLPMALTMCWFWVAFSIAWLEHERKTERSLTALAATAPVRPSSESATARPAHAPGPESVTSGGGCAGDAVGWVWAERRRRRRDVEAADSRRRAANILVCGRGKKRRAGNTAKF